MYSSQNSLQVSKMWQLCWFTYDLCVKNGRSYSQFLGGFIMFSRGKEKCSEGDGDQSIIGDILIRSSPKHYCWPLSYLRRPWKSRKLLFQNTNFDHRNWAKTNTSLCCSKLAVVDHVVYSLWVGWSLFKSGTLPLMSHKFIKVDSFSKLFRKTPRRAKPGAKPFPTVDETLS